MRPPEFPANAEWLRKQAAAIAAAHPLVSVDRRQPFHADCIDTFDAAIEAIEAGAQRVEVTAPTPEQWRVNGGM